MPLMVGHQQGGRDFRPRFFVMAGVMSVAMLFLIARLYHLQISRGEEYNAKSKDNFIKETRLLADRGMILDANHEVMVDNRPSYDVTLTPAFCQPSGAPKGYCLNEIVPKLATYLSLTADEVARISEQFRKATGLKRFRAFNVKADVDRDSLDRLEANRLDLAGVDIVPAPHRSYRHGALAAHVLGYMNEISSDELESYERAGNENYQLGDYIGRRGVERLLETELRGQDGKGFTIVDAKGRQIAGHAATLELARRPGAEANPLLKDVPLDLAAKPGHNAVLSIDLRLQQVAEESFPGKAGAVAVVDVNTGFILAMVSKPAYDPNKLTGRISRVELREISEDPLEPLIFRAVQQHYHPGSTYKVVTALAGLEQGVITNHTAVHCNGGYSLGKRRWRCHKDSGHGTADLHHAIAWSCDTFFYYASDRMGVDPIADMARHLGFGRPPGLDLAPEVPGIVPSIEYHNKVTPGGYTKGLALNTAIGQGDTNVSPIQLLMAYAALANGGTLYRPQVVKRLEDAQGRVLESMQPIVVDRLQVKPEHLAAVNDGLRAVVQEPGGTAYSKRLKNVTVAGKTGTAQVIAIGGVRLKENQMDFFHRDHAWFVAFAPVEQPEIAVVVLNEHGGHGGSASGPTGMAIIDAYFKNKAADQGVPPPPEPASSPRPPPSIAPPPALPEPPGPPEPAPSPREAGGAAPEVRPWS